MPTTSYDLTDAQAQIVHDGIASTLAATKNWVLSAIERGDIVRAQELTREARALQTLFATFNVRAHQMIAAAKGAR